MGKSTAVSAWFDSLEEGQRSSTKIVDLREYGNEDRLVREVFGSDQMRDWTHGDGELHLVLDSLDECQTRVPQIGSLIGGQIGQLPVNRLHLWIVCRTSNWPTALEKTLKDIYGETFRAYEITPLSLEDVIKMANSFGVDGQSFAAVVDSAGVGPLAAKPLTLRMLLNLFQNSGTLPRYQFELYRMGIEHLCTEWAPSRLDAGAAGQLSAKERIAIAARVAAIAWLCRKPLVRRVDDGSALTELEMTVEELSIGAEPVGNSKVDVNRSNILEVLNTGLFSGRGTGRLGWAHESYGEFLAATYIRGRLTTEQAIRLLTTRVTGSTRVVPQLQQIAAWAVALQPGLEVLVDEDPEAISTAGVGIYDDNLRGRLVDRLLALAAGPGLRMGFGIDYRLLAHSGLVAQLDGVLNNSSAPLDARLLAADITRGARVQALVPVLADTALAISVPLVLRLRAADAVAEIGDEAARMRLKCLVMGGDDDPDDDLKGVALRATWPWAFDPDDLFAFFTAPKRRNFIGAYGMFLRSDLLERVDQHLPDALNWLGGHLQQPDSVGDEVVEMLTSRAWQRVNEPDVRHALAALILRAIRQHAGVLRHVVREDHPTLRSNESDEIRRLVLLDLIELADAADSMSIAFAYPSVALMDDFVPLMDGMRDRGREAPQVLQGVVGRLFSPWRLDHVECAASVSVESTLYRDYFAQWFEPILINSETAQRARSRIAQTVEPPAPAPLVEITAEEVRNRVRAELDAYEAGDTEAWWRCCVQLTLSPGNTLYTNRRDIEPDLTKLPGWENSYPEDRDRLLNTAGSYLSRGDPRIDVWWSTNSIWRPALAGYKAMILLLHHRPSDLGKLPMDAWLKWLPVIYRFPLFDQAQLDEDDQRSLLQIALRRNPQAAGDAVKQLVRRANEAKTPLSEKKLIDDPWHEDVAAALVTELETDLLHESVEGDVLELLLHHGNDRGFQFAVQRLECEDWNGDPRGAKAGLELLDNDTGRWWPTVWQCILTNNAFGRSLITAIAISLRSALLVPSTSGALADLYLWLAEEFPESTDPLFDDAHMVEPREHIGLLRDTVLERLTKLGTLDSLAALRRVVAARPDVLWLKRSLSIAEELVRRESWEPLSIDALLSLGARGTARTVQSGVDLVEVVVEALDTLQKSLAGQTPMARFLWDEASQKPKKEDAISDYVAEFLRRHLTEKGVIVNREVEVRRAPGSGIGERTDIQVEAAVATGDGCLDVITVVIEVKGNWNPDLLTSIKTQLWERYMKDIGTSYGVYLVAWFGSSSWDKSDYRQGRVASLDRADVDRKLGAASLSFQQEGADIRPVILDIPLF